MPLSETLQSQRLAAPGIATENNLNGRQIRVRKSVLIGYLILATALTAADTVAPDSDGFRVHQISSAYQTGETTVRVLLPDKLDASKKYRVLYVLPVVAAAERRLGDGLRQLRDLGLHNAHDLICVAPEFTAPPWFADHDGDPGMRDESHLLKVVLPFVEATYPAIREADGRLLIGFSKSGWGALSLLLRHPQTFHKAAAWDTGIRVDTGPIDEADRTQRIARIFGSRENFDEYRISSLLRGKGSGLGPEARLFYYSNGGVRAEGGAQIHRLMLELGIPHRYLYEPKRPHRWDSGWIPQAVEFLVDGP